MTTTVSSGQGGGGAGKTAGNGGESSEDVYGSELSFGGLSSSNNDNDSRVISEKVQQLASEIYREFESMIQKYDEESVKNLMPLVVNVLESLDLAYLENEEREVEIELLKEDNEQLVSQYEREKQSRKAIEQRCVESDDQNEAERRELKEKLESLESIVRMLELKSKNSADHASRFEEREAELKLEYSKLHDRYTELFRTHMDYMERTKFLMGSEKFDMLNNAHFGGHVKLRGHDSLNEDSFILNGPTGAEDIAANRILNEAQEWNTETSAHNPEIMNVLEDDQSLKRRSMNMSNPVDNIEVSSEDSLGADLTGGLVDPAEFASAGMGREVENLIKENTELLETKNALNIVKNDLIAKVDDLTSEHDILREEIRSLETIRTKLNERIKELEQELSEAKQKLDAATNMDDSSDVPMAQRKRFTRVEMARVLMERNQYKEKLFELQEAVRWTEMIRASRHDPSAKRKRSPILEFFSGLFHSSTPASTNAVQLQVRKSHRPREGAPGSDPVIRKRENRAKPLDFLDSEYASNEKRTAERKEQYKHVKAHVQKDEAGRYQAYGWSISSLDAKNSAVPVPLYCQPLLEEERNLKTWCATHVTLDRSALCDVDADSEILAYIDATDKRSLLADYFKCIRPQACNATGLNLKKDGNDAVDGAAAPCLSLVWICSSMYGKSLVSIVKASRPDAIIDSFTVCNSHLLCATTVPGVAASSTTNDKDSISIRISDPGSEASNDKEEFASLGRITWLQLDSFEAEAASSESSTQNSEVNSAQKLSPQDGNGDSLAALQAADTKTLLGEPEQSDIVFERQASALQRLPTVWMGSQSGHLFIHSCLMNWRKCIRRVKLPDAILNITFNCDRVFVALADATVAVFSRRKDGDWLMDGVHTVVFGWPQYSVRCLCAVGDKMWCAYRNKIHVLDCRTLAITHTFDAYARKESQIRQLISVGHGVWCSIRLDSTLRLFHSETYLPLQDIDIEPYVSKVLGTNKFGFSFVRVTALMETCERLWIGTGNGVIISIPLGKDASFSHSKSLADLDRSCKGPGTVRRVNSEQLTECEVFSGGETVHDPPYCSLLRAQFSFHGHKDAVKFFVAAPDYVSNRSSESQTQSTDAAPQKTAAVTSVIVISGGDGYIDFRMGDEDECYSNTTAAMKRDLPYLIVWEDKCPVFDKCPQ